MKLFIPAVVIIIIACAAFAQQNNLSKLETKINENKGVLSGLTNNEMGSYIQDKLSMPAGFTTKFADSFRDNSRVLLKEGKLYLEGKTGGYNPDGTYEYASTGIVDLKALSSMTNPKSEPKLESVFLNPSTGEVKLGFSNGKDLSAKGVVVGVAGERVHFENPGSAMKLQLNGQGFEFSNNGRPIALDYNPKTGLIEFKSDGVFKTPIGDLTVKSNQGNPTYSQTIDTVMGTDGRSKEVLKSITVTDASYFIGRDKSFFTGSGEVFTRTDVGQGYYGYKLQPGSIFAEAIKTQGQMFLAKVFAVSGDTAITFLPNSVGDQSLKNWVSTFYADGTDHLRFNLERVAGSLNPGVILRNPNGVYSSQSQAGIIMEPGYFGYQTGKPILAPRQTLEVTTSYQSLGRNWGPTWQMISSDPLKQGQIADVKWSYPAGTSSAQFGAGNGAIASSLEDLGKRIYDGVDNTFKFIGTKLPSNLPPKSDTPIELTPLVLIGSGFYTAATEGKK